MWWQSWCETNVYDESNLKWAQVNVTNTYLSMWMWDNEETSLNEYSNKNIEFKTLNTNDEMRNHLLSYDVLILEASFHDIWVECNGTLYWVLIDELWAVMPSFGKGEGSRNSHEMRLSGLPCMDLHTSPSLWIYTANIGIWRVNSHIR